jgi:hypothetical protein
VILSISERVIEVILERLRRIRRANGYRTDAGLHVFDSRATVDVRELPAILFFELSETPTDETAGGASASMFMTLSLQIAARVVADSDETGKSLRELKADIKRAALNCYRIVDCESERKGIADIVYKGAQAEPRPDGATTEGVILNFDVKYHEGYGDPYASR